MSLFRTITTVGVDGAKIADDADGPEHTAPSHWLLFVVCVGQQLSLSEHCVAVEEAGSSEASHCSQQLDSLQHDWFHSNSFSFLPIRLKGRMTVGTGNRKFVCCRKTNNKFSTGSSDTLKNTLKKKILNFS